MSATSREQFCAVLASGPVLRGDAIVLLTGDGEARIPVALELFVQRAAPVIVVSGGLDQPPHSLPASRIAALLHGKGVSPDRIRTDDASMHTQDQARHVFALAESEGWRRLLLIASPYHSYRAFLTFLRVLLDVGKAETIHLVCIPASQTPWFGSPEGLTATRFELLAEEFAKVDRYGAQGHVASYEDGIAYLKHWEGK